MDLVSTHNLGFFVEIMDSVFLLENLKDTLYGLSFQEELRNILD